jgi:hypothetical protein
MTRCLSRCRLNSIDVNYKASARTHIGYKTQQYKQTQTEQSTKQNKTNKAYKEYEWSTGIKILNPEKHPEVDSIMHLISTESDLKKRSVSQRKRRVSTNGKQLKHI